MTRQPIGPPVLIRFPAELRTRADEESERLGIPLAELVRRAVTAYLTDPEETAT